MTRAKISTMVLGLLVVCSCSTPPRIVHEASKPVKPKWIDTPPGQGETMFFVGIKTGAATMEEARESSTKDAFNQIAGYIRSDVSSEFKDFTTEIESRITSKITSQSTATIQGAEIVDTYFDKTSRIEKSITLESINFFTLVSFSKAEALKELLRQRQEREKNVQLAYNGFQQGESAEKIGDFKKAMTFYIQARDEIRDMKDTVDLKDGEFANSKELLLGLDNRISEVQRKAHSVSITYSYSGDAQLINNSKVLFTPFENTLSSTLSTRGFPSLKPASINIEGKIQITNTGTVMGNYVCFTEGTFTANSASTKEILATVYWKEKTLDKNLAQAVNTGLVNAAATIGDSLSAKLLLLEKYR